MVLSTHSDAGCYNEYKVRSRAGVHIILSENDPEYVWNGPVLAIAQIIIFVMNSVTDA